VTGPGVRAPLSQRALLGATGAVLLLAAASTVTIAAASGAFDNSTGTARGSACTPPALTGATVSVRLADMRSMMTRGTMMGGSGMMRQGDWRYFHRGMMRVLTSATSVPAGAVSLAVTNTGYLTHELVVLPLRAGQGVDTRVPAADGTVDETGSLGEASATCAAGEGDGIAAGSSGWVTLRLPAGRYELVCNLPGHYAAGMVAELDAQ
jgi:uncharacterized cupredoxin-like copper-binding protein